MLLKDLYYIHVIAKKQNLTRAAGILGVTQSALSHAVNRIEKEFSVSLFSRHPDGISLTEAGEAFVRQAERILEECQIMEEKMSCYSQTAHNKLKIGVTSLHEKYVIPLLVKTYSSKFPKIDIEFLSGSSADLEYRALQGSLDLCIMPLPVRSDNLTIQPLFEEEILLAVSAKNPLASAFSYRQLEASDLVHFKDETLIITRRSGKFAAFCLDLCRHSFSPTKLLEINSLDTLCALVANNIGFGFIPATMAQPAYLNEQIICFHMKSLPCRQSFVMAYRADRPLQTVAEKFISNASQVFHSEN